MSTIGTGGKVDDQDEWEDIGPMRCYSVVVITRDFDPSPNSRNPGSNPGSTCRIPASGPSPFISRLVDQGILINN